MTTESETLRALYVDDGVGLIVVLPDAGSTPPQGVLPIPRSMGSTGVARRGPGNLNVGPHAR
jgi:hypothetical protein